MRQARRGEAGGSARHGEATVSHILVEGVVVVLEMGHEQIAVAVHVVVVVGDAHAGLCTALAAKCSSGL